MVIAINIYEVKFTSGSLSSCLLNNNFRGFKLSNEMGNEKLGIMLNFLFLLFSIFFASSNFSFSNPFLNSCKNKVALISVVILLIYSRISQISYRDFANCYVSSLSRYLDSNFAFPVPATINFDDLETFFISIRVWFSSNNSEIFALSSSAFETSLLLFK